MSICWEVAVMSNLFLAGMARLKKDKIFWCLLAVMTASALFLVISRQDSLGRTERIIEEGIRTGADVSFYTQIWEESSASDGLFFMWASVIGQAVAVFGAFYIGADYSYGTIRNKIIAGHRRNRIYFSGFVFCCLAGLTMGTIYMALVTILEIFLMGGLQFHTAVPLLLLWDCLMMTVAFAAVTNMISMLIPGRSYGLIVNLAVLALLMFVAGVMIESLNAPEYIKTGLISSEEGTIPIMERNPGYITGILRTVFQTVVDILPCGQAIQLGSGGPENPDRLWIYSAAVTMVVHGAGCAAFRRKNLK